MTCDSVEGIHDNTEPAPPLVNHPPPSPPPPSQQPPGTSDPPSHLIPPFSSITICRRCLAVHTGTGTVEPPSPTSTKMAKKKKSKTAALRAALASFDAKAYFGTGTLEDWNRVLRDLGLVDEPLESITQCRKLLKTKHINFVDFLESVAGTNGRTLPPKMFKNRFELAAYSKREKRVVNKNLVKSYGKVASAFLRDLDGG